MRVVLLTVYLVSALLAGSRNAYTQTRLEVTVTPAVISRGESTELRFTLEQADRLEKFLPPSLRDFTIIGGPYTESGMDILNGQTRRYAAVYYRLQPRRPGEIVVGTATAVVQGRLIKSKPVTLKVLSGAPAPSQPSGLPADATYLDYLLQPGEDVRKKIDRNLFVRVEADKTSCFVGEPVVATYKLYTRLKSESNVVKSPAFNGFSVVELLPPQSGMNYAVEKFNGRDYNVYLLRKVQLYPLQPGTAQLEPAAVENRLQFIRSEYLPQSATDLLSAWMPGMLPAEAMVEHQVTVETKPLDILVKSLPETGRPSSFTGAVGQFNLSALVENDSLQTGDAGLLKILLTGSGNMPLVPAPDIPWPAGIEGYEPVVKDGYNKLSIPVSGSRIFDYAFSVDSPGNYLLPAVEFSYFDPASSRYQTVSTRAIPLYITVGNKKQAATPTGSGHVNMAWWWLLPVSGFCLLVWWFLAKNRKHPPRPADPEPVVQPASQPPHLPQAPLLRSEALLLHDNPQLFYQALHQELTGFLSVQLGIMPENVSAKTLSAAMEQAGYRLADRLETVSLLDHITARVYTPFAEASQMQDDFVRTVQLIRKIRS